MIDYLILNWIDLGILIALILIFIQLGQSLNIINGSLHNIHGKLNEIYFSLKTK